MGPKPDSRASTGSESQPRAGVKLYTPGHEKIPIPFGCCYSFRFQKCNRAGVQKAFRERENGRWPCRRLSTKTTLPSPMLFCTDTQESRGACGLQTLPEGTRFCRRSVFPRPMEPFDTYRRFRKPTRRLVRDRHTTSWSALHAPSHDHKSCSACPGLIRAGSKEHRRTRQTEKYNRPYCLAFWGFSACFNEPRQRSSVYQRNPGGPNGHATSPSLVSKLTSSLKLVTGKPTRVATRCTTSIKL